MKRNYLRIKKTLGYLPVKMMAQDLMQAKVIRQLAHQKERSSHCVHDGLQQQKA